MKYCCDQCLYKTNDRSNWNKHIKSTKHNKMNIGVRKSGSLLARQKLVVRQDTPEEGKINRKNVKSEYVCKYCNLNFSRKSSFTRHMKNCTWYKTTTLNENNLGKFKDESLRSDYDKLMQRLELFQEKIDIVTEENKHLRKTIDNSGYVSKKSVSALNFVMEKYNDAPSLKKISDNDMKKKMITLGGDSLEVTLIRQYYLEEFDSYIGRFIVGMYYKEDPKEQSVWTSDTSRLTYIIKQLLSNGDSQWITDKRGVKFKEIVIKPLLDKIAEILKAYPPDILEENEKKRPVWSWEVISAYQIARVKAIMSIEDRSMDEKVLKYAAPYLFVDKTDSSNREMVAFHKKKYGK